MSNSVRKGRPAATDEDPVEAAYHEFLEAFYEEEDAERSNLIANRLEELLASSPQTANSIRGEEIRSLIAECRGDYPEAARCRESEIRQILELHALSVNTDHWAFIARSYDHGDLSDRLDLLALLYDKMGDLTRAVQVIRESKRYCQSHRIPFDAQDVLDELEQAHTEASAAGGPIDLDAAFDDAVRATYAGWRSSIDDIVVNDRLARLFTNEVKFRLPGALAFTVQSVKRRLLTLSRRPPSRGGLPRRPATAG